MPSRRASQYRRLRPYLVVTAAVAVVLTFYRPSALTRFDDDLYDAMTRVLPRGLPSGRVVIVDIDERSLNAVGQWPWPRDVVAQLLDRLRGLGASVVALDMIFAERDREAAAPTRAGRQARRPPNAAAPPSATDSLLADSMRQGGVVLGYAMTFDAAARTAGDCVLHPLPAAIVRPGGGPSEPHLYRATGAICSLPVLADAAGASGFLNAAPDPDGILRRVPLVVERDGQIYPGLSLAAVVSATGVREIDLQVTDRNTNWLLLGERSVPLDGQGNVLVRYRGPEGTFPYVSAADVLDERAARDTFSGKLVFVGATALGTQEDVATSVQTLFPGVEIQATVADSLLTGEFVRRPGYAPFLEGALVALGIPVAIVVYRIGGGQGAFLVAVTAAALWAGAIGLFARGLFLSPLLALGSVAIGFVAGLVFRLTDDRSAADVRAEKALRQAFAAASTKDEILRKVSHELRTPLTAIAGWAQLLGTGSLSPRQRDQAMSTIKRNVQAQTRLIENLVETSELAGDRVLLERVPVDLRDVVHAALERQRPAFAARHIRVDVDVDAAPCVVLGDAARLGQIADALLSNAAKFTPDGKAVRVRVGEDAGEVELAVEDEGIGIAPSFKPYVFERFRQQDDMTTHPGGGLGLGLAIARDLVQLHGGSIAVASDGEGSGAAFTVRLPQHHT
jgi:signal transduction histidine kinase